MHRVGTSCSREDEDDDRQEIFSLERLHQLGTTRRTKRGRRRAGLGSLPLGAWTKGWKGFHQVVDATRFVGESLAVQEVVYLGGRLSALREGDVVVQFDGARLFHHDGCRSRSEEHTSELQSRQYLVCRL